MVTFAENAYTRLSEIWRDVTPTVQAIGDSIKSFLTDTGAVDKIIKVLELYASLKIGGAGLGLMTGMSGMGGLGTFGQVAGAAGAAGKASTLAAGAIGTVGTIALTATAVTIAAQVASLLHGTSGKEFDMFDGDSIWASIGNTFIRKSQSAVDEDRGRSAYLDRLVKTFGEMDMAGQTYQSRMQSLISDGDMLAASMLSAAAAANSAAAALGSIGAPSGPGGMSQSEFTSDVHSYIGLAAASGLATEMANQAQAKQPKAPKGGGGGGGGTMKVEITITSNQAPGQIARLVKDELLNLRRHPRSSPYAPNFAGVTRG